MTGLSPLAALAFLVFSLPIGIWVAWSDLSKMKIPNKAVMALAVTRELAMMPLAGAKRLACSFANGVAKQINSALIIPHLLSCVSASCRSLQRWLRL